MPLSPAEVVEVDTLVAAVVARLSVRVRELTDAMTGEVLDRIPAYTRGQHDHDALHSSYRRMCGLLLRAFEGRRRLYAEELVSLHVIGAQAARNGVPAEAVVDGARIALQAAWLHILDDVAEVDRGPAALAAVGVLSSVLFEFGQDVTAAMQGGYRTEADQRTTGRLRAQATFIERILEGHWTDDTEIRSQAYALGYELGPFCALLAVLPGAGQDVTALRKGVAALVNTLGRAMEGPLFASPVPHVLVLVSSAGPVDVVDKVYDAGDLLARERLVVVPTEAVSELHQLAALYRRAYRYLPLSYAVVHGPGAVPVKELRLQAVLGGIPLQERVDFVREVLGPVVDLPLNKGEELLETLEVLYRRRGRVADVAGDLHLHQNSIRYRLNRIEELTGLSLDVPGDRLHIELAMRLRTIAAEDLARLDTLIVGRPSSSDRTA